MRVFITSTPDELEPFQEAAIDLVRELGHEPMVRDPAARRDLDPVSACRRQVALADAVVAIVGWRRGRVPSVALGGDKLRPWTWWEIEGAFEHDVPVVALLAGETFAPELREELPEARALVDDFRGELARLAAVFDDEDDFRRLARAKLHEAERASRAPDPLAIPLKRRRFPPPELPPRPYPLLLPIEHPDLMTGRGDDLASLRRLLDRPLTVVGLQAASGTGKSSLLAGGLVPALRAEGRPVAFERHPAEARLTERLLADLVEDDGMAACKTGTRSTGARSFADLLTALRRLADDTPPVLVVDQFEDVLQEGAEQARAVLGQLLAASAQRLPGAFDPPCRWLLAYRQEYHGKLVAWLGDVLREARSEDLEPLPHDLSEPTRFTAWTLRPLATPSSGAENPVREVTQVFLEAIEAPLSLRTYPWSFAPGHAERLARAFAEARLRWLDAPLAPELQVVLARLLDEAGEPTDGQSRAVEVPDEPEELIDQALEEHLRRSLVYAFPQGDARDRTRVLLVLRELADIHGRREEGRTAETLAQALGEQGRELLEKLSTPRTRIVLLERQGDATSSWVYVLSHDRLAEVLVRLVDEGRWITLKSPDGVDARLLGLRRFVVLQSQLFATGDTDQATVVPAARFRKIEAEKEVLLWNDAHHAWWKACRGRHRHERRRRWLYRGAAIVVVALAALVAWMLADRRSRHLALLDEAAAGKPEVAFAALDRLTRRPHDSEELRSLLRQRERPFDVFERGLGGVDETRRAETLVRLAELALPILEASPEDPVLIASLVWALDFFSGPFEVRGGGLARRGLATLRRRRPPPPRPVAGDPHWADIPAGTFRMGSDDWRADERRRDAFPRRLVTLSAFRMLAHEVTFAQYRRLVPEHPRPERPDADDLPVGDVSWYAAYTYAAWLGGRLPTEAEWEYAARADCAYLYCRRDGREATLDDVAWWIGNVEDPVTRELAIRPVMQLEPNPWGLWDVYGNAWDWIADWIDNYPRTHETNPPGPTSSPSLTRVVRGGSSGYRKEWLTPSARMDINPDNAYYMMGFRVVFGSGPERAAPGNTGRRPPK